MLGEGKTTKLSPFTGGNTKCQKPSERQLMVLQHSLTLPLNPGIVVQVLKSNEMKTPMHTNLHANMYNSFLCNGQYQKEEILFSGNLREGKQCNVILL